MHATTPDHTADGGRAWASAPSGPSALVVAMAVVVVTLLVGLAVLLLTGPGAGSAAN